MYSSSVFILGFYNTRPKHACCPVSRLLPDLIIAEFATEAQARDPAPLSPLLRSRFLQEPTRRTGPDGRGEGRARAVDRSLLILPNVSVATYPRSVLHGNILGVCFV